MANTIHLDYSTALAHTLVVRCVTAGLRIYAGLCSLCMRLHNAFTKGALLHTQPVIRKRICIKPKVRQGEAE